MLPLLSWFQVEISLCICLGSVVLWTSEFVRRLVPKVICCFWWKCSSFNYQTFFHGRPCTRYYLIYTMSIFIITNLSNYPGGSVFTYSINNFRRRILYCPLPVRFWRGWRSNIWAERSDISNWKGWWVVDWTNRGNQNRDISF